MAYIHSSPAFIVEVGLACEAKGGDDIYNCRVSNPFYYYCWSYLVSIDKLYCEIALALFPDLPTVRLQYAKNEGEAWENLSHEWYQVDRGGEGPHWKNELEAWSCSFEFWTFVKRKAYRSWFKTNVCKMRPFNQELLPPLPPLSVYLGRHWHIRIVNAARPSPFVFAYCKQPKTGQWEGLGTRLK